MECILRDGRSNGFVYQPFLCVLEVLGLFNAVGENLRHFVFFHNGMKLLPVELMEFYAQIFLWDPQTSSIPLKHSQDPKRAPRDPHGMELVTRMHI